MKSTAGSGPRGMLYEALNTIGITKVSHYNCHAFVLCDKAVIISESVNSGPSTAAMDSELGEVYEKIGQQVHTTTTCLQCVYKIHRTLRPIRISLDTRSKRLKSRTDPSE